MDLSCREVLQPGSSGVHQKQVEATDDKVIISATKLASQVVINEP
jgi:hypothetical protein